MAVGITVVSNGAASHVPAEMPAAEPRHSLGLENVAVQAAAAPWRDPSGLQRPQGADDGELRKDAGGAPRRAAAPYPGVIHWE